MARAICVLVFITALLAVCGGQLGVAAQPNAAELPVAEVTGFFQVVTSLSSKLQKKIGTLYFPTVFDEVKPDLETIASIINEFNGILAIQDVRPFKDADAGQVDDSPKTFVSAQQEMLITLINQFGLLQLSLIYIQPIRDGLLTLQKSVNALAVNVLNLIPTSQKPLAQTRFNSLNISLSQAISTYKPLYCVDNLSGFYVECQGRLIPASP